MRRAATLLLAVAPAGTGGLGGCAPPPPPEEDAPAETWPVGTVLAVNGRPVTAAEVDALAELIEVLYPQYTRPHLRRLALTNGIFPMLAVQSGDPTAREESLRAAEEAHARLVAARGGSDEPAPAPPEAVVAEGGWRALGFELWTHVHDAPAGSWLGPFELPGRYVVCRIDARPRAGEATGWRVAIVDFPYLAADALQREVDAAVDRSVLTVVDRAWGEFVPENWKHRMSGGG